jgi:transcriptional regulator with XRE-family HTH domain
VATHRMPFQTPDLFGASDGLTNAHIRKQIHRLRLSRGWTKRDLEEAAQLAPDTLEDFEAGIRCINVDTLRKLIEALDSDITEVWPSPDGVGKARNIPLPGKAEEPLHLSRLAEIHSLAGAEASFMCMGEELAEITEISVEKTSVPALHVLSSINLDRHESEWLCCQIQRGDIASPWKVYLCSENGRRLYLCLKNGHLEFWAEGFIQRCLSTWLGSNRL